MPFATSGRGPIYWRQDGASNHPALVLVHPALFDHTVWDRMVPFLVEHFRVIRLDLPGHGVSPDRANNNSAAGFAADVLAVMDSAGIERALVCGLSLGSVVGLTLAANEPDRVCGVVAALCEGDFDTNWLAHRSVPDHGTSVEASVESYLERAFSAPQREQLAQWIDPLRLAMLSTTPDGMRHAAACQAASDLSQLLAECKVPGTVLLAGACSDTGSWRHRSALQVVRTTGRCLPPIEAPGELAMAVARLHDRIQPDGAGLDPARHGEKVRRAVLGDTWVDRSIAARDAWICDYQDYATEVAWHTIWGRKGLDYRTRRLLVLALTSALGRWEEFRFHARLGLERGSLTIQDIKEVSLQTGLYAGVPVSNTAFNEMRAIFSEMGISFPAD